MVGVGSAREEEAWLVWVTVLSGVDGCLLIREFLGMMKLMT